MISSEYVKELRRIEDEEHKHEELSVPDLGTLAPRQNSA